MIFCNKCFTDSEIVSIIKHSPEKGKCPICGTRNAHLYNTETDTELRDLFEPFLSMYTPLENLPEEYPIDELKPLQDVLAEDWCIFSDIGRDKIIQIAKELSPVICEDTPTLFSSPVGILEKLNPDYLQKHSILGNQKWADFVEGIKYKNRFHTNSINTNLLKVYCNQIVKNIGISSRKFYRGRISQTETGFQKNEMGAPPQKVATDGRANSFGISRLYLAYDVDTTLHEIRAAEFDYVTIANFKLVESIRVVDLKRIGRISPFLPDVDSTELAINREHLQKIAHEIGRTVRRGDSLLDYLPTQYICDFIMSIEDENGKYRFDGIEYQSAMKDGGANLAIFYPGKFKCTSCSTYEVIELKYSKRRLMER